MSTKRKNEVEEKAGVKSSKISGDVHAFFKPKSSKNKTDIHSELPELKMVWESQEDSFKHPDTLLVGKTENFNPSGFKWALLLDLDGTLIRVKGSHVHAKSADDWQLHNSKVIEKLQQYRDEGAGIVILSNQGGLDPNKNKGKGLDKLIEFQKKIQQISYEIKLPFILLASLGNDRYRKPRIGMWEYLEKICGRSLDRNKSIFVGDAAGRPATSVPKKKKDFSDTDRKLALNLELKFFTPEEFFLSQAPQNYTLSGFDAKAYLSNLKEKKLVNKLDIKPENQNECEMILMVGFPGSGKTSAYKRYLQPYGYEWINNDTLKTKEACLKASEKHLSSNKSLVIDNTNMDALTRKPYIELAKRFKARVRCFVFPTDHALCKHNSLFRSTSLCHSSVNGKIVAPIPDMVFHSFNKKYQAPNENEGIDLIETYPFVPLFSTEWNDSGLSPEEQEKEWTLHYF